MPTPQDRGDKVTGFRQIHREAEENKDQALGHANVQ
jgi:hypothetical protein